MSLTTNAMPVVRRPSLSHTLSHTHSLFGLRWAPALLSSFACPHSLAHPPAPHSLPHSLPHSHTLSLSLSTARSLARSLFRSLTPSIPHARPPTRSLTRPLIPGRWDRWAGAAVQRYHQRSLGRTFEPALRWRRPDRQWEWPHQPRLRRVRRHPRGNPRAGERGLVIDRLLLFSCRLSRFRMGLSSRGLPSVHRVGAGLVAVVHICVVLGVGFYGPTVRPHLCSL